MGFKIGDRVKVFSFRDDEVTGTIVDIEDADDLPVYVIEMNINFETHDCHGKVPSNKGWWCHDNHIELIGSRYININKKIPKFNLTN